MQNINNRLPSSFPISQETPPRPICPPKRFLDDSASMTSSTITSREKFARRTDEKSATRRSISRNSREKSIDTLDISKFYTKMTVKSQENDTAQLRRGMINRNDDYEPVKKRSPTPLPGKVKKKNKGEDNVDEQLEAEITICELQKRLQSQDEEKRALAKSVGVLEREIRTKLMKIQQLERNLAESTQRQSIARKKLGELQSLLTSNQSSLTEARNNLDRLKSTIKQNKYEQIENENTRLKQQNSNLRQQVQKMKSQMQAMSSQTQSILKQAEVLRKINQQLSSYRQLERKRREIQELYYLLQSNKGQKENTLEQLLEKSARQNQQIKIKLEKVQLRLLFLHRKKNQEVDAVRDSKNEVIIKLRKKITTLTAQNQTLIAEVEQLKERTQECRFSAKMPHRKNNFLEDTQGQQTFRLDLSP